MVNTIVTIPNLIYRERDFEGPVLYSNANKSTLTTVEEADPGEGRSATKKVTFRVMITTCGLRVEKGERKLEWKKPATKSKERIAIMSTKYERRWGSSISCLEQAEAGL